MPRIFLTCTLLDCKAHVAPVFQGRNGGPGRMVLKLGPIQGHGGHYPPPALQHMTVSADGLFIGRGRRSSISSSQLQPTSPCMSAGSQPQTTARCFLPIRWTNATSAPSNRARPSSFPRVSALPVLCAPPLTFGRSRPGCALPCPGVSPALWSLLGPHRGHEALQPPAWLCSWRPGLWDCVGP